MNFENKLISGVFLKRYKRFFADIKVKNKLIKAHCPNSGSMMGLLKKGNHVWITKSNNPNRKLKYTLQIIKVKNSKIGVNTHFTNKIVNHGLENNLIRYIVPPFMINHVEAIEGVNLFKTLTGSLPLNNEYTLATYQQSIRNIIQDLNSKVPP